MTRQSKIWDCIVNHFPRRRWASLEEIYALVQNHLRLDREDLELYSPRSRIPKWKRNVRNVLQYRKTTGKIEWDGLGKYRR